MPLSGMLTCGSCGTRTQISTMRYNLNGSKLICQSCVDKERSSIKPGTTQASSIRLRQQQVQRDLAAKSQPIETAGEDAESAGMSAYHCRSCHFRFARKKDAEVTGCPYCGRQTIGPQYTGSAQSLIEESAGTEEEMF